MESRCTKGWSWGSYILKDDSIDLLIDSSLGIRIPYADISNCSMPGKNELALEFQQDDTIEDDIVCEMRVFLPEDHILRQGDEGREMFFIATGDCVVLVKGMESESQVLMDDIFDIIFPLSNRVIEIS